jgi:hypothetical protein
MVRERRRVADEATSAVFQTEELDGEKFEAALLKIH